MSDIVVKENQPMAEAAPVVSNATSMLAMIGTMASSPECDIDKVERLFALQASMQDKENETAFNAAMSAAQADMGVIIKNKWNDQTKSNYADSGAVIGAITPIYTSHGISLSFNSCKAVDGIIPIICYVSACGHTREYNYDSPITDKGIKGTTMMTQAHARGSAVSYGTRYLTKMIFNLATSDDDGNAATQEPVKRITADQVANLQAIIDEIGGDIERRYLKWLQTDSISKIQAANYDNALAQLEKHVK